MSKTKIKFNTPVLDMYGEPVKMPDSSQPPERHVPDGRGGTVPQYPLVAMQFHKAVCNALGHKYEGEQTLPQDKQMFRWRVACKVAKAATPGHSGEVALKPDEITEAVECCNKAYEPFIFGFIKAMMIPDENARDEETVANLGKPQEGEQA